MVIGFKIATALGLALWIYPHFGVDGLLPKFAPLSHRQTRIHYPVASTLSSAHSYGRRGSALRAVDSIDGSADVAVGSILSQNNGTHTVASVQEQLKLFGAMSKPFFVEENDAKWLLGAVVALTLMNSGVSVAFSYLSRDFWSALNSKDAEHFQEVLLKFFGALSAGVPVVVLGGYQRELLALRWREWMVERMLALYLGGGSDGNNHRPDGFANDGEGSEGLKVPAYFAIQSGGSLAGVANKPLDNPDQRIAEDVRAFTRSSLSFGLTIMRSIIDLLSFAAILYSIYPLLFAVIVVYASVGTAATVYLGKQLVALNYKVLQQEADLRFALVRVRENAESIAFYGGEQLERELVDRRLGDLVETRRDILRTERNLDFFTTAYQFLIQILPGAVVAPLFFSGKVELGVVSQSFGAFNHILNDFSIIVNQFESLSQFSAGVDRLGEFAIRLQVETGAPGVMQLPEGHSGSSAAVKARAAAALAVLGEEGEEKALGGKESEALPAASAEVLARAGTLMSGGFSSSDRVATDKTSSTTTTSTAESTSAAATLANSVDADAQILSEALRKSSSSSSSSSLSESGHIALRVVPGLSGVVVRGLTLRTPDGSRTLVRGLDLTLQAPGAAEAHRSSSSSTSAAEALHASGGGAGADPASRLLVVGPSGSGKSSVLRAIAGLWTSGAGSVERPPSDAMMILPQRPYCTPGTLREQLMYPQQQKQRLAAGQATQADDEEDQRLLAILDAVNLPGLAAKWSPRCRDIAAATADSSDSTASTSSTSTSTDDEACDVSNQDAAPTLTAREAALGLDAEVDWSSVLSLGEQQRLAFGRLLYNQPKVAVLDEATSALDINSEAAMYNALQEWLPNCAVLSVGHRPSLLAFHTHRLVLRPEEGSSTLEAITAETASQAATY